MSEKKAKLNRLIKNLKETPTIEGARIMKLTLHCKENVKDLVALRHLHYITKIYKENKDVSL